MQKELKELKTQELKNNFIYLFIYDTLKKDLYNHELVKNEEFIGDAVIDGFTMYRSSMLPYLVKGNSTIKGELYKVKKTTIPRLDELKESPTFYKRELTEALSNNILFKAEVYILQDPDVIKDLYKFEAILEF